MQRYLLKQFAVIIIILSIMGGGIGLLLTTPAGVRFSFAVVSKIGKGKLHAHKISGSLIGPVKLSGVSFTNSQLQVKIAEVQLKWDLKKLLLGELAINQLYADKITVTQRAATPTKHRDAGQLIDSLTQLALPSYLTRANIELTNIAWYRSANSIPLLLTSVLVNLKVTSQALTDITVAIRGPQLSYLLQGSCYHSWHLKWYSTLKFNIFSPELKGTLTWKGKVAGERGRPQITTTIKATNFKSTTLAFPKLEGKAHIDLAASTPSSFNLTLLAPKFPSWNLDQVVIKGRVIPALTAQEKSRFTIEIANTTLALPHRVGGTPLQLLHGTLHGEWGRAGATMASTLLWHHHNPMTIKLSLPKLTTIPALLKPQPLSGQLQWQTSNLSLLSTLAPQVKNIRGNLALAYSITGSSFNPQLSGTVKLTGLSCDIPELNIRPTQGEVVAHSLNNRVAYQAKISSGKGHLKLTGETYLGATIKSKLLLEGKNLLVANNARYQITAAPHLALTAIDKEVVLQGTVVLSQAAIHLHNFNTTNLLPSEIVYVKKQPLPSANPLRLAMQLHLEFGDEIYIDLMNLTGQIKGKLQLVMTPEKDTTALGTLYLKNGCYNIYGQNLKITKGNLQFFGGTVSNPTVHLEAIRDFKITNLPSTFNHNNGLVVGVRMHGILDSAKIELFSLPSGLSKADILSYLIIGQPSSQAIGNKAQVLLQAASSLNLGGAGEISSLLNSFKDRLGLSEFGFSEETILNKTDINKTSRTKQPSPRPANNTLITSPTFALGKFITPNIYVSYSMGLMDPINIFRVKYFFNKNWALQSESSSLSSGIDLIYTVTSD